MKKEVNLLLDEVDWIPKKIVSDLKIEGIITLLDLVLIPDNSIQKYKFGEDTLNMIKKARESFGHIEYAHELVGRKQNRIKISSGSVELDNLLGGGFFSGRVTEVYGESGSGKTQLCFQLCVNYQLNSKDDRDIVYVDTVGKFRPERIAEIYGNKKEEIFKRISSVRARTWTQQIDVLNKINKITSKNVGLLIIDTVTDNLVLEFESEKNFKDRQVALSKHLHELAVTAINKDIAVVVTNTVRNRIQTDGNVFIVETGGNTISQGVHLRLRLSKTFQGWIAQLNDDQKSIRFKIGKKGLMDWDN